MPVYNGEKYLKLAVQSILDQTLKDFELIIINDGSTDKTEEIIKSFSDPRIIYIKNDTNLGLSKSYNTGIRASQGEFIARMDADDISLPDRFEKQMKFLELHPEIGITGGAVILIDKSGKKMKKLEKPSSHIELKWQSLFSTPLIHPTVFGRAKIFRDNPYDENLYNSEDYELWSRLIFNTETKLANQEEPVLYYRVYPESFTQRLEDKRKQASTENLIRNIERYTPLSEAEKEVLSRKPSDIREARVVFDIYSRASKEFERKEGFKPSLSRYFLTLGYEFVRGVLW